MKCIFTHASAINIDSDWLEDAMLPTGATYPYPSHAWLHDREKQTHHKLISAYQTRRHHVNSKNLPSLTPDTIAPATRKRFDRSTAIILGFDLETRKSIALIIRDWQFTFHIYIPPHISSDIVFTALQDQVHVGIRPCAPGGAHLASAEAEERLLPFFGFYTRDDTPTPQDPRPLRVHRVSMPVVNEDMLAKVSACLSQWEGACIATHPQVITHVDWQICACVGIRLLEPITLDMAQLPSSAQLTRLTSCDAEYWLNVHQMLALQRHASSTSVESTTKQTAQMDYVIETGRVITLQKCQLPSGPQKNPSTPVTAIAWHDSQCPAVHADDECHPAHAVFKSWTHTTSLLLATPPLLVEDSTEPATTTSSWIDSLVELPVRMKDTIGCMHVIVVDPSWFVSHTRDVTSMYVERVWNERHIHCFVLRHLLDAYRLLADYIKITNPTVLAHHAQSDLLNSIASECPFSVTPVIVPRQFVMRSQRDMLPSDVNIKRLIAEFHPKALTYDPSYIAYIMEHGDPLESSSDAQLPVNQQYAHALQWRSVTILGVVNKALLDLCDAVYVTQQGRFIEFLAIKSSLTASSISDCAHNGHTHLFWASVFLESAARGNFLVQQPHLSPDGVLERSIHQQWSDISLSGGLVLSTQASFSSSTSSNTNLCGQIHHAPVVQLDFKSHYPNIIIDCNLCPSTVIQRKSVEPDTIGRPESTRASEALIAPFTSPTSRCCFTAPPSNSICDSTTRSIDFHHGTHIGIVPSILRRLLTKRQRVQASIRQMTASRGVENAALLASLSVLERVLKVCANAIYGVTALVCIPIAHATTSIGRSLLHMACNEITTSWTPPINLVREMMLHVQSTLITDASLGRVEHSRLTQCAQHLKSWLRSCSSSSSSSSGAEASSVSTAPPPSPPANGWPVSVVCADTDGVNMEIWALRNMASMTPSQYRLVDALARSMQNHVRARLRHHQFLHADIALDAIYHPLIKLPSKKAYAGLRVEPLPSGESMRYSPTYKSTASSRNVPIFVNHATRLVLSSYLKTREPVAAKRQLSEFLNQMATLAASPLSPGDMTACAWFLSSEEMAAVQQDANHRNEPTHHISPAIRASRRWNSQVIAAGRTPHEMYVAGERVVVLCALEPPRGTPSGKSSGSVATKTKPQLVANQWQPADLCIRSLCSNDTSSTAESPVLAMRIRWTAYYAGRLETALGDIIALVQGATPLNQRNIMEQPLLQSVNQLATTWQASC